MLFEQTLRKGKTEDRSWELPCDTKSICPECLQVLDARIYEDQGQVWMEKACPEHGRYNELLCTDKDFFLKRRRTHYELPSGLDTPHTVPEKGCPNDCGLCNQHLSTPCLVNIDLTNKCNLNCPICFANSNASGRLYEVTLEQLNTMLDKTMSIKPHPPISVQYAGGEPTVHPNFLEAVRMAKEKGVLEVQAASNGLRFAQSMEFTRQAAEAGLDVVYLQFDGMRDDIYEYSRGRKLVDKKRQAIENLRQAGIMVTLVPTIVRGLNEDQLGDILQFAIENTDVVTAISFQPVSITGRIDESKRYEMRYTMADMARDLQNQSGILDMYRDWYPFSIVSPISRMLEALTGEPKVHFNCHGHCGAASYLLVDKQRKTAVPFTRFVDIEAAMRDLNKEAQTIENHPWMKTLTKLQVMRKMKKHFHADKAPEGVDFDTFMEFINKFINAGNDVEHHNQKGHVYHMIGERFDVLLLAAMHFQDAYNFELDRVQHCVIHYAAPDGKFYPFCTWNSGPCHRVSVEERFSEQLPTRGAKQSS